MVLLVILGVIVVIFLIHAVRLDRRAAAQGLKYVPVKEQGRLRTRTRLVLVDSDTADEARAQQLHEEAQAQRAARRRNHH